MKNKSFFLILVFFLTVLSGISAFDWPVADPLITSTFGTEKWGGFSSGIDLSSDSAGVSPSEAGEVIFYADANSICAIPAGLGSFVVIEHERKLRTIYGNLEEGSIETESTSVNTDDIIGLAGQSGNSVKPHLFFAVLDSEFEQYVNPLLVLNSISDTEKPVIREIGFSTASGYYPVSGKPVLQAGNAELTAEIFDPSLSSAYFAQMAPYKIHLFLNGEEIFYIGFESIVTSDGLSMTKTPVEISAPDFFKADGKVSLGRINLVPGESRFEILVSDYAGNETSRSFRITVNGN